MLEDENIGVIAPPPLLMIGGNADRVSINAGVILGEGKGVFTDEKRRRDSPPTFIWLALVRNGFASTRRRFLAVVQTGLASMSRRLLAGIRRVFTHEKRSGDISPLFLIYG